MTDTDTILRVQVTINVAILKEFFYLKGLVSNLIPFSALLRLYS